MKLDARKNIYQRHLNDAIERLRSDLEKEGHTQAEIIGMGIDALGEHKVEKLKPEGLLDEQTESQAMETLEKICPSTDPAQ